MELRQWLIPIILGVIMVILGTLVLVLPGKAPTRDVTQDVMLPPAGRPPLASPSFIGVLDLLEVTAPEPGELVRSPLRLSGRARGIWYFEASFPVRILDANGNELGVVLAQATEEWMTEEFVPFTAELTFKASLTATGTLIFQKDNPSGLPEHDRKFEMPVKFR